MKHIDRKNSVKLLSVMTLLLILIACESSHERVTTVPPSNNQTGTGAQVSSGNTAGGSDRKLTVVEGSAQKDNPELAVERIHRLEGSNIEAWISDNEVRINTTKLLKAGTNTEEPKYSYTTSIVDLSTEEQREVIDHQPSLKTAKETISPDGKFSFIQKWLDKYTADNFIMNRSTGKSIAVAGDNYMEMGGWLNNDTYILAAGSMEGRGDIRQIAMDGTFTKLAFEDKDVEIFKRFGVSNGRMYYTDLNNNLKILESGKTQPTILAKGVWDFEISPDGKHIAVTTVSTQENLGTALLIYDSTGSMKGSEIAKGELMSYLSWSPDSSRLAFDVYTTDKTGMNGVYIFDSTSGKVSPLGSSYSPVGMSYNPQYPLTWSPSGKRLGITIEDKKSIIVTQVIDFK
ncbi:hypothetical protein PMSD_25345 [Paenibacillus macquariensis subsp. defensor]|nr:hypothetical protein PMSD_25345 [Paenibacillus macquariensis subsp. defensor]